MGLEDALRSRIKSARKRGRLWVRALDAARWIATAERRSILWTRLLHRHEVHQTTTYTCEDRYPALFDLAATLSPNPERILSFGCSTGEELIALRRRFPNAEIVGAEINPRSRSIARARVSDDPGASVVHPRMVQGTFDVIFALAVLQRQPHKMEEMEVQNLSPHYPFHRFDFAVRNLAAKLSTGGLLCVTNAHYRVEDSSIAPELEPVIVSHRVEGRLFRPDGRVFEGSAHTIFRRLAAARD
jgi:hypothetical protein